MIYELIDRETREVYGTFKVNKNASSKTIIKKMKEELQKIFNYKEEIKMLISGKVDYATGENDLFYICFGIKKNIELKEV